MVRLDWTQVIGWTFAEALELLVHAATVVIGRKGVSEGEGQPPACLQSRSGDQALLFLACHRSLVG